MPAEGKLLFRQRQSKDDPFIIQTSLDTMKKVFKESTGITLTDEMILQQMLASDTVMMIEENKQPIGFYCYTIFPSGEMYISSLILVPSARNKGLGKQVVQHLVREGSAKGVKKLIAHVQTANKRGLAFWKKNKFQVIDTSYQGMVEIERIIDK